VHVAPRKGSHDHIEEQGGMSFPCLLSSWWRMMMTPMTTTTAMMMMMMMMMTTTMVTSYKVEAANTMVA
jgi:hypothetical protein